MKITILPILVALAASACNHEVIHPPAILADDIVADGLQEAWQDRRHDAMAAREAQVATLAKARATLDGRRLGIQRDAAICLEARRAMDARLREAMVPGRDFAADLDAWHDQARGVEDFCAYALTVGVPRELLRKAGH